MCILCSAAGVPCSSCHDGEDGTGFQLCERCTFLIINANLQQCPAPQLLCNQDVRVTTANDQSPEIGTVLLDSDQEDASRPSSEEVQVAGHQFDAAACLLTQIEQPPILASTTCQSCKNASVDGNGVYCQSCQAFYLAIQQEPELQQAFLNPQPQSISPAPPQSVPNAYLHNSLNGAVVHPQYSTSYSHTNSQLQQYQEAPLFPDYGGGQSSTFQQAQFVFPGSSTGVTALPPGLSLGLYQYPLLNLNSEAIFQQSYSAQPLPICRAELPSAVQPSIQTGYSAFIESSAAQVPLCPPSDHTGFPLQQYQVPSTLLLKQRQPLPWQQYVPDVGTGLPCFDNATQPPFNYPAAMDVSSVADQPHQVEPPIGSVPRSPASVQQPLPSSRIPPITRNLAALSYPPSVYTTGTYYQSRDLPSSHSGANIPSIANSVYSINPSPTVQRESLQAQDSGAGPSNTTQYKRVLRFPCIRVRALSTGVLSCHGCGIGLPIRACNGQFRPHYCITCFETNIVLPEAEKAHSSSAPATSPTENREDNNQDAGPSSATATPTKNQGKQVVGHSRRRSPVKLATTLPTPAAMAIFTVGPEPAPNLNEENGGRPTRIQHVRCMEHRGQRVDYIIIDACVGCRVCSAGSKLYQRLLNNRKEPSYTRKNITDATEKLRRWKELELIAYLNGDDECHAQLRRAQGSERYEEMMKEIRKVGGLLPALPWIQSA